MVGGHGYVELRFDAVDDVQVGQGGFDHDDVSAFFDVQSDFAQGFVAIGGIHLIGAAVAKLRGRFGGFAEGAVKAGAEFGGIGHDGDVVEGVCVQGGANGAYAPVHHVGRCD